MTPDVLERVMRCTTLPSLPAVAVRVLELTSDDAVSIRDITETIQNDQGLSAKLLKTVNSSFYGLRQRCASINQAVVLLGLSAVKTLALGFSLVSAINANRGSGFDYPTYWRRGLYTGISAKLLARHMNLPTQEEAFLGGLLQDVGMVALHQAVGAEYMRVLASAGDDHRKLIRVETTDLDTTHPDIGAMLARRWKLPDELVMPIKYHEKPTAAPGTYAPLCRAVGLGNLVSDVLTAAEPAGPLSRLYDRAKTWTNMTSADVDLVVTSAAQASRELARLLQLETAAGPDPEAVLDRARAQLASMTIPDAGEHADAGRSRTGAGLPDATEFNRVLVSAFEQARAASQPLSVALIDIDAYADIKARYAANVAETFLVAVGGVMRSAQIDAAHFLCDLGEGRFGIVMNKSPRLAAARAVDAIRKAFAAPITLGEQAGSVGPLSTGVSVGACTIEPATMPLVSGPESVLALAQRALDAATQAGRNTVRMAVPTAAAA